MREWRRLIGGRRGQSGLGWIFNVLFVSCDLCLPTVPWSLDSG